MLSRWYNLYAKEIEDSGHIEQFICQKVKEKKRLIQEIVQLMPLNGRILEAGCGTGVISSYLAKLNFKVTAVDNDAEMVHLARKISQHQKAVVDFQQADLFHLNYPHNYFDLCFSHGVIEHFVDEQVIHLLNQELEIARWVIFSIPSNYFKGEEKIYGDERLMGFKDWLKIAKKTDGRVIKYFGYAPCYNFKVFFNQIFSLTSPPYIAFILTKL